MARTSKTNPAALKLPSRQVSRQLLDFPESYALEIPAWHHLTHSPVTLDDLSRHIVVFGESGSGKTLSILVQLLEAVLDIAGDPQLGHLAPAIIVGDVKNELEPHITRLNQEHSLGYEIIRARPGCDFRLWAHEGTDVVRDPAATIKAIMDLFPDVTLPSSESYWAREGLGMVEDFLRIELQALRTLDRVLAFRSRFAIEVARAMGEESAAAEYALQLGYNANNYLEAYLNLSQLAVQMHSENRGKESSSVGSLDTRAVNPVFSAFLAVCREFNVPRELTARIQAKAQTYDSGFQGVMNITLNFLMELCNPDFVSHISICPWEPPRDYISIQEVMDKGKLLILGTRDETRFEFAYVKLAMQLLTRFTYRNSNRLRPTILLADEAHRLVDPGITSLVDRGRSFRTWVVLATQSLSGLQRQLEDGKRINAADDLLNKVGTIFWLRTKDPITHEYLARTLPAGDAMLGHIAAVRPVSSFRTGETLVMRANGTFALGRCDLNATRSSVKS